MRACLPLEGRPVF
jgi:hypothetical protein